MSDHADLIAEAKRGTAGYSEGDLRSLAKQLADTLEATVRERDALAAQIEAAKAAFTKPYENTTQPNSRMTAVQAILTADSARILAEHDAKVLEDGAQWRDENPRPFTEEDVEAAAKALNIEGWTYQGEHEPGEYCDDCRNVCLPLARAALDAVTARHTKEGKE